jgi:hypothetical protein
MSWSRSPTARREMTTRAGILWAADHWRELGAATLVWIVVASGIYYEIWVRPWKRPTHVRSVAKAAKR